jgi:thymidylate kinase
MGVLITFSGLDGAGKSTLIASLQRDLEAARRPSVVLHMNDHVGLYAYLRIARDRLGARSPNPPPSQWEALRIRGSANGASGRSARARLVALRNAVVWSKTLRRFLYPVDLLVFLVYRAYIERLRRRVLIMDRYFYDTLVDVADERRQRLIRFLARLTPTPDVAFYVDVDPETAFARKGEFSIQYLRERRQRYAAVLPLVPSRVTLEAGELVATLATLRGVVLSRLADA